MSAPQADRLIDAIDKLNRAYRLFDAALMAIEDIADDRQRKALDTLLFLAANEMRDGIDLASAAGGIA